jgi:ATP-dependent protease HslVU (ClpYQ) peptidase subunit
MTTIVTDGKSMAADGRGCSQDSIVSDRLVKVARLNDGSLLGVSGPSFSLDFFAEWLNNPQNEFPKDIGDFAALHLTRKGEVHLYVESSKRSYREMDLPAGIGSGREFAIGAMLAGASPIEAIRVASLRDPFTGGEFREWSLEDVS